tara:strand:- start:98 stop:1288 length:1191 start_codon:yes stop_codon:yes gene_type:complete
MGYLHKFQQDDIFQNRIITRPHYEFVFYTGSAYINNDRFMGRNIPTGSISAFELNVNRAASSLIYPFVRKDGYWLTLPGVNTGSYSTAQYGDIITGSYPLTASITREYIPAVTYPFPDGTEAQIATYATARKRLLALRNTLDYYRYLSNSYHYTNSFVSGTVNMINIPSIFFDSGIEKGSVSLKFYFTGSLIDEAQDLKRNGELISMSPHSSTSGSVVGVVLYNEGFILLNNADTINTKNEDVYLGSLAGDDRPRWTYFGAYSSASVGHAVYPSASLYTVNFRGTNKIPTMTMMATAQPGELNNSLNPTWLSSSNGYWRRNSVVSPGQYVEPDKLALKNIVQSQYCEFQDSFSRQTFITEIGIFDDHQNLIGVAKLANPVLKTEGDDYTFKLKLDF